MLTTEQGPGRPYLIPCRTTHRRFFPEKHSFSYSYLTVGIPVGWEGNVGGMIGVYDTETKGASSFPSSLRSWFQVTASDHLDREDSGFGLRGKLDRYLLSEQVDPVDYPYAYLVTAPRFLGYSFNPISLWYLYSREKELSAIILEVNNTYGERRPYLVFRDRSDVGDGPARIKHSHINKEFYVSPFNARDGYYSILASDPLGPNTDAFKGLDVTITLNSASFATSDATSKPKLVARLFSQGEALDPTEMHILQALCFVASWSYVGFVTMPRIVKEACVLLYRKGMHMHDKPEPSAKTLGRAPTPLEETIQARFKDFLGYMVSRSKKPLKVEFYTDGFSAVPAARFSSPTKRQKESIDRIGYDAVERDHLEMRVLTPAFYSNFIRRVDSLEVILHEMSIEKTIFVDKPDLLPDVFPKPVKPDKGWLWLARRWQSLGTLEYALAAITSRLREKLPESASFTPPVETVVRHRFHFLRFNMDLGYASWLDTYMLMVHRDVKLRRQYQWAAIRQLFRDNVSRGGVGFFVFLLTVLCFILYAIFLVVLLCVIMYAISKSVLKPVWR